VKRATATPCGILKWALGCRARCGLSRENIGMGLAARVAGPLAAIDPISASAGGRRPTLVLRSRAFTTPEVHVTGHREAQELLLIEEADAWFEYLEATRGQAETRYGEIEPWAWARLTQRLRAIRARRAKLRPAAA
jgi:hypothetical protein